MAGKLGQPDIGDVYTTSWDTIAHKDGYERENALKKLRMRIEKGEGPSSFSSRGTARRLKFPGGKVEVCPR